MSTAQVDCILGSLAPLYTEQVQHALEGALESIGRMLFTGTFGLEDVAALSHLEEILDDGVDGIAAFREELAELRTTL